MTFSELTALISSKFDFTISLERPYKLCDYKPAYGYIFENYIKDYYFWGHCDIDTIMGNLKHFLTDEIFNMYDKIFCLGHMTLYKNTFENNRLFMSKYNGVYLYKNVLSSPEIHWFDEAWKYVNINDIFKEHKKRIYKKDLSMGIAIMRTYFQRSEYRGIDEYPLIMDIKLKNLLMLCIFGIKANYLDYVYGEIKYIDRILFIYIFKSVHYILQIKPYHVINGKFLQIKSYL